VTAARPGLRSITPATSGDLLRILGAGTQDDHIFIAILSAGEVFLQIC
jgi:hypothetical protein